MAREGDGKFNSPVNKQLARWQTIHQMADNPPDSG